jgi:LPXTG-motif cell wall-anchored protein
MEELADGVYEMDNLPYGEYTVKETKAPEGFYLDEGTYAFSIKENGKTIIVENEAGKGFINKAQVGNIRIEKTSEDGVLKGFTFRVEGSDLTGNAFSKDFVTDANGQIHIEGLRVGNYVISEVGNKANEKYVLPENVTVTVHEGKTVVAKFYNELKPVIPDVPKTGDTTNMPLWAALAGISLLGAGAVAFFTFRKKKEVGKHER